MAETGNKSVVTSLAVLEELSNSQGTGVSPLARRLGLPKSTVQRALVTLGAAGWVWQDDHARWSLTLRCAVIGQRVMNRTTLTEVVRPLLVDLRDHTRETVRCFLIQAMNIVLLDVAESDQAVRPVQDDLPSTVPLHVSAIGKAALAARPEACEPYLRAPLAALTSRSIVDPQALDADISNARERGWAEIREEAHLDVGSVAAVTDLGPDIMVGVEISYPMHRVPGDRAAAYGESAREYSRRVAQIVGPRLSL